MTSTEDETLSTEHDTEAKRSGDRPAARAGRPARSARPDSRERLLAAARAEFAGKGLEGARVDEIARRAGVNKQLVYHHFGAKEDLYRLVLETVYAEIRERERALDLTRLAPEEAMRRLVEFSFDYLDRNRDFVALLADENFHKGRHLDANENLARLHSPLIDAIDAALARGREQGLFHDGIDPRQLYISIAALGFFYFSNIHTLSAIFSDKLDDRAAIAARRAHAVDFVMRSLRADPGDQDG